VGIFVEILSCAPIAPEKIPLSDSAPSTSSDPQELVRSLAERFRRFRSLRALASVYYSGTDGRGGFQEAILVQRPNRLRLETLSPLGAILIVTVDADEVAGFHPREGLFYRGRSSKENLFRYIQIPLELQEVTSLLLGLPPVQIQGQWEKTGNDIYREIERGGRDIVTFDPRLEIPIKWERLNLNGNTEMSALFFDFFSSPAGPFPLKISFEAHTQQVHLEIQYQEPELNAMLPLTLFSQKKPTNAKEIPLESLGG
jgi:hypothetical protein